MADARTVPVRGVEPARRRAASASQDHAGPLQRTRLRHGGLRPRQEECMSFLEYAPAPQSRSVVELKKSYGLFIDGEFVDGHGSPFTTISPADESPLAEIAYANEKDVDTA